MNKDLNVIFKVKQNKSKIIKYKKITDFYKISIGKETNLKLCKEIEDNNFTKIIMNMIFNSNKRKSQIKKMKYKSNDEENVIKIFGEDFVQNNKKKM